MLVQKRALNEVVETREHALACAKTVADRYRCNYEHANFLMETACMIFDKIKTLHGLNPSYKHCWKLQQFYMTAAILSIQSITLIAMLIL